MKSTSLIWLLLVLFVVSSCSETSSNGQVILPNNLVVEVNYLGEGIVEAKFTAEKAVFYKVSFGTPGESLVRVDGNSAIKTFTTKGDFVLLVQAHTTENDFIANEDIIRINAAFLGEGPNAGYESPSSYEGYDLVWADEFSDSGLSSDWRHELGDGCPAICGWGSDELQFYKEENTSVVDGNLIITAKKESEGTSDYTSSRINTQGKQSFTYGRVDVRARLPKGQGFWPSFWMMGTNIDEVGWPKSGALHIMDMLGGDLEDRDDTIFASTYWDNAGQNDLVREKTKLPFGIFNDEFHVFSIVWDPVQITWLLDGVEYHYFEISDPEREEFHKPFFIIFNLSVGGVEPGNPDETSVFPQEMSVDYIRVFQEK